ncbi:MAG: FeoB-associated Cys-rich membrane protein [Coriobacteriales bacterium]|nr:FeoB-associated Cys-rich membrane protein [Coriobacteriales bacterium]
MNLPTVIILALVAVGVVLALRSVIKRKGSCSCGCDQCSCGCCGTTPQKR